MMYRKWIKMAVYVILIFLVMISPVSAQKPVENADLLVQIKEEAAKKYVPAINARVDRVWHAIPGYIGLEVDVEKTYELAKNQSQSKEIHYIYQEVVPEINLEDLGPKPIYRGNPEKRMVSIMVNVAWGDEFIPTILDVFEKEQVRATFFFDGSWLSKHRSTAEQIAKLGHELSNHAYSHKNMSRLNRQMANEEIAKTEKLLKQLGVNNRLFAPPSGDYNMETVRIAHELNLKTVLWLVDTVDWKHPSPDSIIQKISAQVEPGAMILMDPTHSSSKALAGMIKAIKRKGYRLDTVSELLSTKRVPEVSALIWKEPIHKKAF